MLTAVSATPITHHFRFTPSRLVVLTAKRQTRIIIAKTSVGIQGLMLNIFDREGPIAVPSPETKYFGSTFLTITFMPFAQDLRGLSTPELADQADSHKPNPQQCGWYTSPIKESCRQRIRRLTPCQRQQVAASAHPAPVQSVSRLSAQIAPAA